MVDESESSIPLGDFLRSPDVNLEDVLLNPQCIKSYADGDPLLIIYLCRHQTIREMIEIIRRDSSIPLLSEDQYPLSAVVGLLFLHEVSNVSDSFVDCKEAVEDLYSLLQDVQNPPNFFTLELVSRIFVHVCSQPAILQFLASKTDLADILLHHLGELCVRNLFSSFFTNLPPEGTIVLSQTLDRQCVVQRLLKCFLQNEVDGGIDAKNRIFAGLFLRQLIYQLRLLHYRESLDVNALLSRLESENTVKQIVDAIITLPQRGTEMLSHFLNLLRHLLFDAVLNDLGVDLLSLPLRQTKSGDDFVSKGIARHFDLVLNIFPRLKSFLAVEGVVYDAEDNVSTSRTCLPLQPLGMGRINAMRFLCHLIFNCQGVEGAEVVEQFAQLDLIGTMVDLFFAFKWNTLMHCTLEFLTQVILRRAFHYSPAPKESSVLAEGASGTIIAANKSAPRRKHFKLFSRKGPSTHTPDQQLQESSPSTGPLPYSLPNALRPYGKILHQMVVKHRFLDRLLTAWDLNKVSKGKAGFRRAGYMGHLQEMALRLAWYFYPDLAESLDYPTVKDSDVAALNDEAFWWKPHESNSRSDNGGSSRVGDGKAMEENMMSEELLNWESNVRKCILRDLPDTTLERWTNFITSDLRQAVRVSNVEHLRNLKATLIGTPSKLKPISPTLLSPEAAIQAYNRYKMQPLTMAFTENFGFRENEFDVSPGILEELLDSLFGELGASLILQEYTQAEALFDEVCNTIIKTPDGIEVSKTSSGWPVICIKSQENQSVLSAMLLSSPSQTSSVVGTREGESSCAGRRRASTDRQVQSYNVRSTDWLTGVFDEAHTEILLESEDTLSSIYNDEVEESRLSQDVSDEAEMLGMDFFHSVLSPVRSAGSPITVRENEEKREEEENETMDNLDGLENDLRTQLSLVPEPTLSNGRPMMSFGRSRRISSTNESFSEHLNPTVERWSVTSRSLGTLNSPDLPDSESLVLPRLILDRDLRLNSNSSHQEETLPRPIQPTIRTHRLARTSLLRPLNGDLEVANRISSPFEDHSRRKRLVKSPELEADIEVAEQNDSKLRAVIGQEPISRTVHLVLSPSVANQAKAAIAAQKPYNHSSEDLDRLKEQYLQYLNNYYYTTNSEVSALSHDPQTGDENEVINVEIEVADGVEQRGENAFQHLARALGFRPAQEAPEVQNVELGGEDPIDLFDFAYAVFRVSILVAICITYASWQRMALVAAVGFYFYWRNFARQNEVRRRRLNDAPVPPPQRPQPQPAQEGQGSSTEVVSQSGTDSSALQAITTAAAAEASTGGAAVAGQSRVGQIAGALRAAGDTSVRLVCAIFSSLVPELPARID
ncbi:Serine/threonine-protein phosphatase 6 regulatory subunit 2 [Taenia crassiceps]|uniref:Serine/threonine-protein phosphatase 6 regulatory subunit 2 n=1 Tax=Taenia crassiceps TaxID=6207 RepID=A0ABR4QE39_9CEST